MTGEANICNLIPRKAINPEENRNHDTPQNVRPVFPVLQGYAVIY
jgi:hypothetical protein